MLFAPLSSIASRDVITLAESDTIHSAVSLMAAHSIHDVVVVTADGLRIITIQTVIRLRLAEADFSAPLSQACLPRVSCVKPTESVADGLVALRGSPSEHLCLVDENERLVGIVSYTDLISRIDPQNMAETVRIKDLIRLTHYSHLEPDDTLRTAMQQMHSAGHSAALISLPNQTIGIITQSDITRALQTHADWQHPVTEFMSAPAFTVEEDLTIQQAITVSRERRLKRLVVTDKRGEVVGLLHQKDLVGLAYESWRELLKRHEEDVQAALDATENEQRWRAVLEGTQQGVWDWNAQTNKVFFSPTWKSMLGYSEDEIGDSLDEWDSRIHPDDKAATYADLERHFSGETSVYENTHRVRCKDGSYKWIQDKGKVFSTDADGKPLRVIGTHTDITAEYEQKQQLNRLAENVPGVLYQYRLFPDGSSYFPFATANIRDVYGVFPEQVAKDARIVLERLHPDDAERVATSIGESADRLTVWEEQYRYNHPETGERWLEGRATPERMADGSIIWNGYIYDITERKQQELKLAETTAQFQLTMEATDTGLWTRDLLTNEVNWSPQAYSMLGYEPDEFAVTLEKFQELVHPDDLQNMMSGVMSSIEQGSGFNVQFRLRHAGGYWVWIQGRGKVTERDTAGKPCFMMGTYFNINALKETEEKLNKSRERLMLATESADLGIWDLDMKTGRLEWDQGMFSLYGMRPDEFSGEINDWSNAIVKEYRDQVVETFRSALEHETTLVLTMPVCRRSDSEVRILHGEAKIIRDSAGEVLRVVGINRDVTEQEEARRALATAKAEADAANRAKSDFLANMSHEIRTPMSGIIGLSQISIDEQDVVTLQDRLRKIHRSGRLLLGIINDILDFSRIESGKLEIDPQPFFLPGLLDNLKSLFAQMAAEKGLQLNISTDDSAGKAYVGDELRLRQVLTNLLGNAIKFTEKGTVTLNVSVKVTDDGLRRLSFCVTDTGIGISSEQQQKLFTAFSQADNSITRKHGGSGLGLVISQRLVEAMGGARIELESELHQGSSFGFSLIMPVCSPGQEQALLQSIPDSLGYFQNLQGRVLLVEDNEINQEVAKALLQQYGLNVTVATNGVEALELFEQKDFDLIFMDIQMPMMDGYEATRQLRARGCQLPIIALTAAAMAEDQQKAFDAGMNSHLAKPIDTQELQQVLVHWLLKVDKTVSAVSANTQVFEHLPPRTNGFDPAAGLAMLAGNRPLYRKVLTEFLQQLESEYQALPDTLRSLQSDGQEAAVAAAQRKAHSLKGVAGNLALKDLAQCAVSLDRVLKQAQLPEIQSINTLEHTLKQTATEIKRWLDEQGEKNEVVGCYRSSNDTLEADLQQLLQAIQNSEFIDESLLNNVEKQVLPYAQDAWRRLCQALDDFDFDKAKIQLSQLKKLLSELHH
ncbi:PAS domain-containing protein [Marinobacterium iners]|uniref:histidine kinase n=1 Tax=Marinobacterium iners DSM 11526 TaxID=1122198 RepID=A0A1H4FHA8_9GAMM|nr:PAS domain S-box-containing protein [Marinobacterium iners DSM 11526]